MDGLGDLVKIIIAAPFVAAGAIIIGPIVGAYYTGKYLNDHRPDLQIFDHTLELEEGM